MKGLLFFCVFVAMISCNGKKGFHIPENPAMVGLAMPYPISNDGILNMQDYFVDVRQIDSVSSVKGLQLMLSPDKERLGFKVERAELLPISDLRIWAGEDVYSILLTKFGEGNTDSVSSSGYTVHVPEIQIGKQQGDHIALTIKNGYDEIFVLWENYRLPALMTVAEGGNLTITIPGEALEMERSTLRITAYNQAGIAIMALATLSNSKLVSENQNRPQSAALLKYVDN